MKTMWCRVFVACLRCASGRIRLKILSPRHYAALDIATVRENGGVDLDVSIESDTHAEYVRDVKGRSICVYINGSIFTGSLKCAAAYNVRGPFLPSTAWQLGKAWLHLEMFQTLWSRLAGVTGIVFGLCSYTSYIQVRERSRCAARSEHPSLSRNGCKKSASKKAPCQPQ